MPEPAMRIAGDSERSLPRRINFTVAALERVECPPGKDRVVVYDARVPGLALRVTSNGAKSFTLYRKWNGMPVKMRLGGFPEISIEQARILAGKHNGEMAQGIDPRAARQSVRKSLTLQELFDRYGKEHADLRSTVRTRITDKSRFDTCFADWKSRKVATITSANVRDKHADIARGLVSHKRDGKARTRASDERTRGGKVSANRAVQLLRRLLKWARIEPNPAAQGVVDFFRETPRERFVQAEELPRFFAALEVEPNATIRDFVKVALFTGARRSNVQSMRWDELNAGAATWAIPASKSKNAQAMTIHVSPQAMEIIEARKGNGSAFVFPGRGKSGHLEEPKGAWRKILERAGIADLRLHDLRRTLGSWQAAGGASLPIIGKSLGHKNQSTTQIYARLNLDPVRLSVNAAGAAIAAAGVAAPVKKEPAAKSAKRARKSNAK